MRIANPVICFESRLEAILEGGVNEILESNICFRFEPEFAFEINRITTKISQGSQLKWQGKHTICRETIALFVSPGDLEPGIYMVCVLALNLPILRFWIDVRTAVDQLSSAALAGRQDSRFHRDRYELQSLPFADMLHIARSRLTEHQAKLVLITGSVGKTTTKELLSFVGRSSALHIAKSSDSWNFPHEICSQIANNDWADCFVLEVALNNFLSVMGEILRPDIFIITDVGAAHTTVSTDLYDIARKKVGLAARMGINGKIVANVANPYVKRAIEEIHPVCEVISVSADVNVDARIKVEANHRQTTYVIDGRKATGPVLSRHLPPNAVACALASYLLLDTSSSAVTVFTQKILEFPAIRGRMESTWAEGVEILNDAYNANPLSMRNLFAALKSARVQRKKILLVLGEMADLGTLSGEMHAQILREAEDVCDSLVVVGDEYRAIRRDSHTFFSNSAGDEIITFVRNEMLRFDIVAFKGSHSSGIFNLVGKILKK